MKEPNDFKVGDIIVLKRFPVLDKIVALQEFDGIEYAGLTGHVFQSITAIRHATKEEKIWYTLVQMGED